MVRSVLSNGSDSLLRGGERAATRGCAQACGQPVQTRRTSLCAAWGQRCGNCRHNDEPVSAPCGNVLHPLCARNTSPSAGSVAMAGSYPHWELNVLRQMSEVGGQRGPGRPDLAERQAGLALGCLWFEYVFDSGGECRERAGAAPPGRAGPARRGHRGTGRGRAAAGRRSAGPHRAAWPGSGRWWPTSTRNWPGGWPGTAADAGQPGAKPPAHARSPGGTLPAGGSLR